MDEWLAFRPTPHIDGVWVEFDPGSRYGYKKFVHPGFRGRHIAAGLSAYGDPLHRFQSKGTNSLGFRFNVPGSAPVARPARSFPAASG